MIRKTNETLYQRKKSFISYDLDVLGNLVNTDTKWNITGTLIKKVDLKESDIFCTVGRTLYIPVR